MASSRVEFTLFMYNLVFDLIFILLLLRNSIQILCKLRQIWRILLKICVVGMFVVVA
jgi:hypothetical protein